MYASNRGHDSIVMYAVDEDSGRLTYIGHEPTGGNYPRNFAIDPTGTFLLAANQNSGTIRSFWIDAQNRKVIFYRAGDSGACTGVHKIFSGGIRCQN